MDMEYGTHPREPLHGGEEEILQPHSATLAPHLHNALHVHRPKIKQDKDRCWGMTGKNRTPLAW